MTPPPLPTTAHPAIWRSNSGAGQNPAQLPLQPPPPLIQRPKPPTTPPPPPPPAPKPSHDPDHRPANHGSKYLNRSFSDVAYGRSPVVNGGRPRPPRHSQEFDGQRLDIVNDVGEEMIAGGGGQSPTAKSPHRANSFGDTSNGSFETSPAASNRFLPTMGVSMLGKKRLSNVSADCSAIEKAVTLYRQLSERSVDDRRPSLSSPQVVTASGTQWN